METIFSYARLVVGCTAAFGGLAVIAQSSEDMKIWGVILGGIGLATAMHEMAYVISRYVRSKE